MKIECSEPFSDGFLCDRDRDRAKAVDRSVVFNRHSTPLALLPGRSGALSSRSESCFCPVKTSACSQGRCSESAATAPASRATDPQEPRPRPPVPCGRDRSKEKSSGGLAQPSISTRRFPIRSRALREQVRFAIDSPLEEAGFELSVPGPF
jgi:hypothetical protein